MDIGGEGVSVYAEAKGEYTKQLCQYLLPALQQYFLDLLEEAKLKEAEPRKTLLSFQVLLEGISDWNVDKVQRETAALSTATHCDYLEELITAVFIAHTKVLSAIRLTTKQKKLQITIPKLDHFLHRTLTECARLLWSNTYLFSTNAPAIERQKNLRLIESLLNDAVLQSIRGMLPVKNILREYLKEDNSDDEAEEGVENEAATTTAAAVATTPSVAENESTEAAVAPAPAAPAPTENTIVDSSAPAEAVPIFTGIDTVFAEEDEKAAAGGGDDDSFSESDASEGGAANEDIQIIDAPPEPMDDCEDLNPSQPAEPPAAPAQEDDILAMDFEELN